MTKDICYQTSWWEFISSVKRYSTKKADISSFSPNPASLWQRGNTWKASFVALQYNYFYDENNYNDPSIIFFETEWELIFVVHFRINLAPWFIEISVKWWPTDLQIWAISLEPKSLSAQWLSVSGLGLSCLLTIHVITAGMSSCNYGDSKRCCETLINTIRYGIIHHEFRRHQYNNNLK